MNQELIQQQLHEWLIDFVEKPNPLLNGWAPCPHARKSRISGKFGIKFTTGANLVSDIEAAAQELTDRDVIAICFDPADISAQNLAQLVSEQNQKLMLNDVLLLEDHPDDEEWLNGVKMNFEHCGIVFVQQLSKINQASAQLRDRGYYDHWPQENLDSVVNWRVNSNDDLLSNQPQQN
jgi:hypothetical protein